MLIFIFFSRLDSQLIFFSVHVDKELPICNFHSINANDIYNGDLRLLQLLPSNT